MLTVAGEVEEKYKDSRKNGANEDDADDDGSSSDESEDEAGFLATEELDARISATLQAIRTKDPRVYDKNVTFYQEEDLNAAPEAKPKEKKEKPVYLKDYHREKFMRGDVGASDDEDDAPPPPKSYAQEQEELQKSIINQMHATNSGDEGDSDSDDGFMKRKEPAQVDSNDVHPSRAQGMKKSKAADLNIETAEKDPETFLSNFMAARAWVPEEGSHWAAFESDDGEEDNNARAETFEEAYNLRFEDPEKSNEVLKSYARDLAASRSVRRDEKSARKKRRDAERERKEEEKLQRKEEKARLRKLKLEEAEEKLRKVKQAAGSVGKELKDEDWLKFLDEAWDNDAWEEEMKRRFGDEYYAMEEGAEESDNEDEDGRGEKKKKKKHPKKPTWDDDIDIKDIVPDFDEGKPQLSLDDDNEEEPAEAEEEEEEEEENEESGSRPPKKRKTADHKRARIESQKQARKERAKLEALVDSKLELSNHDLLAKAAAAGGGGFRYRETEPLSFGMTARDILLAPSDADLNQYAGLKKLAPFRPAEKRQRDAQRLSKKKRLRQWRRDVFGKEYEREGPTYGFEKVAGDDGREEEEAAAAGGARRQQQRDDGSGNIVGDVGGSRKKRKRSKNKKAKEAS